MCYHVRFVCFRVLPWTFTLCVCYVCVFFVGVCAHELFLCVRVPFPLYLFFVFECFVCVFDCVCASCVCFVVCVFSLRACFVCACVFGVCA